jgi:hypothetical protein
MWLIPEFSKASRSLFSELQWNLISFGSDGGIGTYPSVKNLLEQKVGNYHHYRHQQAQERETELLEQVGNAIEQLKRLLGVIMKGLAVNQIGKSQRVALKGAIQPNAQVVQTDFRSPGVLESRSRYGDALVLTDGSMPIGFDRLCNKCSVDNEKPILSHGSR